MKLLGTTAAALLAIGLSGLITSSPANAAAALGGAASLGTDAATLAADIVEPATYYGYGYYPRRRYYGYYPYRRRYYRPHYYYAPRAYGYYGYRY